MADTLLEQVREIITRYSMLAPGRKAGVAVSGGADSVALLHLLHRLVPDLGLGLMVLHVNHQLRGAESEGDEEFVCNLAQSLNLPLVVQQSLPPKGQPEATGNLEQQARDLRRAFFIECIRNYGLSAVALGHTRTDQAETVLHRLLRGAGLTGLAGMRPVSSTGLIRPLLETNRSDIRAWLRQEGLRWREDSSNADTRFTRNRLRLETLPTLASRYNPNLEAALAGTAHLAQAEEEYWEAQTEELRRLMVRRHRLGLLVETDGLQALQLAVRRRLIRRLLRDLRRDELRGVEARHVEAVLEICGSAAGHDRVVIPGIDALRSFTTLLLSPIGLLAAEKRNYRLALSAGQMVDLPFGAGQICIKEVTPECGFRDNVEDAQQLGVERVRLSFQGLGTQPLWVRNWQPGDELHRPDHQRPEKVKQLFQEHRVRLWERRHWPVVIAKESIVWVRDFGISRDAGPSGSNGAEVELVFRSSGIPL